MGIQDESAVMICAVGDIVPNRDEPETLFALAPVLKQADITFGQLESVITDKYSYMDSSGWGPGPADPKNIKALTAGGFNLISFASNNGLDWGPEAFLDTIRRLEEAGIRVIGAGKDIDEARKPAIFEVKGARIGFLAYNTICFKGYEARVNKPGCVPMRAWTAYHQTEPEQPGTPCEVVTWAYADDLEALLTDIKNLRPQVDILAISIHWGIHMIPKTIAMYQAQIAHAAIDAGVDIIFGHHPHILKGIEVYKGKVIFYSLNMFGFDWPPGVTTEMFEDVCKRYDYTIDPEYPHFPFLKDALKTILVKCTIADNKIERVSFLPALVNKQNQPEILTRGSEHFNKVVEYMREITVGQGLNAEFAVDSDEVVISSAGPATRKWLPTIALPIIDR